MDLAPFYIGQKVVGSNRVLPSSRIKKGAPYVIRVCECMINPANGLGPFWYVGVEEFPDHDWLAPYLFVPIQEASIMTFSEIRKVEENEVLINN